MTSTLLELLLTMMLILVSCLMTITAVYLFHCLRVRSANYIYALILLVISVLIVIGILWYILPNAFLYLPVYLHSYIAVATATEKDGTLSGIFILATTVNLYKFFSPRR